MATMIYTYMAQVDGAMLDPVDTVQFKFVNGNAWGLMKTQKANVPSRATARWL